MQTEESDKKFIRPEKTWTYFFHFSMCTLYDGFLDPPLLYTNDFELAKSKYFNIWCCHAASKQTIDISTCMIEATMSNELSSHSHFSFYSWNFTGIRLSKSKFNVFRHALLVLCNGFLITFPTMLTQSCT